MWFQFTRNLTSKYQKTTDQYRYFLLLVRSNNLRSKNQSGFTPGDSCINQLFSITHEIYQFFDDTLEVGALFLD